VLEHVGQQRVYGGVELVTAETDLHPAVGGADVDRPVLGSGQHAPERHPVANGLGQISVAGGGLRSLTGLQDQPTDCIL